MYRDSKCRLFFLEQQSAIINRGIAVVVSLFVSRATEQGGHERNTFATQEYSFVCTSCLHSGSLHNQLNNYHRYPSNKRQQNRYQKINEVLKKICSLALWLSKEYNKIIVPQFPLLLFYLFPLDYIPSATFTKKVSILISWCCPLHPSSLLSLCCTALLCHASPLPEEAKRLNTF